MEPELISRDAFLVLGLLTHLAPEQQNEQAFKSIWSTFEERLEHIRAHSTDGAFYGISYRADERGSVDYLAAMAVRPPTEAPAGLVFREVPPSRYAVFACPVESIGETYRFVFTAWLPGSPFELNAAVPVFEQYPPEGQESLPVLLHIPIKKHYEVATLQG